MRRRVLEHIPAREADRQLKLGEGGLRDVEFAVQLLQLVHGRGDERIRASTTLSALAALTAGGYVGREDGEALHEAYSFLRTLEHRLQLHRLQRLHVVPDDPVALRRLGRSLGFIKEPAESLLKVWQHHRREVRRLHEKLFYRPLLEAVAQLPGAGVRMSAEAAQARLAALGYDDPVAALRHLEALTNGVSRTATIQRALLPALLGWFADGANPDAGLAGFRRLSENLGGTPWYLKTLRDEGQVAERLAVLLSTSRYLTDLLEREPKGVQLLGDDLTPLPSEQLADEMRSTAGRQDDPEKAVRAVRAVRRRELLRIGAGDVFGHTDVADVGMGLSRLTDATLEATLGVAVRAVQRERSLDEAPTRLAVVAMGRYGGFELSYGSDADVLFVHRPEAGADPQQSASFAQAVVLELRRLLALPGGDPPLEVDADLRPEGRQGPLVRTLESYAAYYDRWSHVWEAQALLRADAVVGDEDLRRDFTELIDELSVPGGRPRRGRRRRDPADQGARRSGAAPEGRRPAAAPQARPRGTGRHRVDRPAAPDADAADVPGLRTPHTLAALDAAREAGLVAGPDAEVLTEGWRTVSRVRNAVTLARGKPSDQMPSDVRERAAVAAILGYPPAAPMRWSTTTCARPGSREGGRPAVLVVVRRTALEPGTCASCCQNLREA